MCKDIYNDIIEDKASLGKSYKTYRPAKIRKLETKVIKEFQNFGFGNEKFQIDDFAKLVDLGHIYEFYELLSKYFFETILDDYRIKEESKKDKENQA